MEIEDNIATLDRIGLEIPDVLRALDMWSKPEVISRRLEAGFGKTGLVSLCQEFDQKATYHPDGVYEFAKLGKSDAPGIYTADIIDEDESQRRVRFSLRNLGGILVPKIKSSGFVFPVQEYLGRLKKLKLRGQFGYRPRKVLETQIGNTVLVNTSGRPLCYGTYTPAIVDGCDEEYCQIRRMNPIGELASEEVGYSQFSRIFVQEKDAPPKLIKTD